ncbi:MAG: hypothetical protein WBB25_14505 [Sulfitobacter sp.]
MWNFEPNYEGSAIIGGSGHPGAVGSHEIRARPGHHLTPRPVSGGKGVFDALGTGFTLLTTDDDAGFAHAARELGVPLDIVAVPAQSAVDWDAKRVLVRPDSFVAWAGEEAVPAKVLARAAGWRA